jgi:hypothetical protein
MDAAIVDDNGQPLGADGFAAIGTELGQLYAALDSHDLGAGSATARRLFRCRPPPPAAGSSCPGTPSRRGSLP